MIFYCWLNKLKVARENILVHSYNSTYTFLWSTYCQKEKKIYCVSFELLSIIFKIHITQLIKLQQ